MKRIMLITGGSRGIGAATARLAARDGYDVCISYAGNKAAATAVAEEVRSAGRRAVMVQGDVANEDDVTRLFAACTDELGTPDVLVNNAGILFEVARLEDMSRERWQRVLEVNVIGVALCSRAAIKCMSTRHGGRGGAIVNVASRASVIGSPNEFIDYAASKGAIDSLTIGLAREIATEGIRVNAVRPGLIYTDIHASAGRPDRVDALKANVPMQRGGTPEEVAEAVLWLASDAASYVTGTFVEVSGGR